MDIVEYAHLAINMIHCNSYVLELAHAQQTNG